MSCEICFKEIKSSKNQWQKIIYFNETWKKKSWRLTKLWNFVKVFSLMMCIENWYGLILWFGIHSRWINLTIKRLLKITCNVKSYFFNVFYIRFRSYAWKMIQLTLKHSIYYWSLMEYRIMLKMHKTWYTVNL